MIPFDALSYLGGSEWFGTETNGLEANIHN